MGPKLRGIKVPRTSALDPVQRYYANTHHSGPRERVSTSAKSPYARSNHYTVKDKAQHAVILDKATSDKLYKDVQSYRLITVATLVDRLKINGSLARRCLADLEEKGQIKKIVGHSKLQIYSTCSTERPGVKGQQPGTAMAMATTPNRMLT